MEGRSTLTGLRIGAVSLSNGVGGKAKFGSAEMEKVIRMIKPDLCIFDPLQGYIPAEVNMASRNTMRSCLAPLVTLGEELGTAFLIVCHTNKRTGAADRSRLANKCPATGCRSLELYDEVKNLPRVSMTF